MNVSTHIVPTNVPFLGKQMAVDNSTWSKQLRKSYKYSSFARKNNHMMDNPYAKDDAVVSVDTGVDTVDSMRALAISAVQCSYHTKGTCSSCVCVYMLADANLPYQYE